jgi:hypothetical protein
MATERDKPVENYRKGEDGKKIMDQLLAYNEG